MRVRGGVGHGGRGATRVFCPRCDSTHRPWAGLGFAATWGRPAAASQKTARLIGVVRRQPAATRDKRTRRMGFYLTAVRSGTAGRGAPLRGGNPVLLARLCVTDAASRRCRPGQQATSTTCIHPPPPHWYHNNGFVMCLSPPSHRSLLVCPARPWTELAERSPGRKSKLGAEKRCSAFSAPPQQVRSSPTRPRQRRSPTSTMSPSPCSRWCGRPTLALTALSLLGRCVRRLLLAIPKNDARDRRSARHTAGSQPSELGEARACRGAEEERRNDLLSRAELNCCGRAALISLL